MSHTTTEVHVYEQISHFGMRNLDLLKEILSSYFPFDEEFIEKTAKHMSALIEEPDRQLTIEEEDLYKQLNDHVENHHLVASILDRFQDDPEGVKKFINLNLSCVPKPTTRRVYFLYKGNNKRLQRFRNRPLEGVRDDDFNTVTTDNGIKFPVSECMCSIQPITIVPDPVIDVLGR